ncbi:MAG TPA: AraC family transcriptional regulator [Trebonia sp.]
MQDWARYWRAQSAPVEAMHAHFTKHVYHRHSHESYSFGVTEAGAQAFTCRRGRHVSGPGLVMAFNPDDPHDGHAGDEDGFTYRMIHIWPGYFAGVLDSPAALPLFREPLIDDPALARTLLRLHAALTGGAPELVRAERLIQAAAILDRHASRGPRGGQGRGSRAGGSRAVTREIAARVRRRIDGDGPAAPGADLTLADLAAAAGCSRYAAYRAFSAAYGMPPSDYQRQLRVRTARGLLAAGIPPATVAAEAGFADQAHLTRWFRRYYGVTPGAYQAAVLSGVDGEAGDHERDPGQIPLGGDLTEHDQSHDRRDGRQQG